MNKNDDLDKLFILLIIGDIVVLILSILIIIGMIVSW